MIRSDLTSLIRPLMKECLLYKIFLVLLEWRFMY